MNSIREWIKTNKFTAHTIVFLGMVVASGLLYFSAGAGNPVIVWILLGIFALSNLFSLSV